jgi:hypothetical protein
MIGLRRITGRFRPYRQHYGCDDHHDKQRQQHHGSQILTSRRRNSRLFLRRLRSAMTSASVIHGRNGANRRTSRRRGFIIAIPAAAKIFRPSTSTDVRNAHADSNICEFLNRSGIGEELMSTSDLVEYDIYISTSPNSEAAREIEQILRHRGVAVSTYT